LVLIFFFNVIKNKNKKQNMSYISDEEILTRLPLSDEQRKNFLEYLSKHREEEIKLQRGEQQEHQTELSLPASDSAQTEIQAATGQDQPVVSHEC
jgi:hypothetical protein